MLSGRELTRSPYGQTRTLTTDYRTFFFLLCRVSSRTYICITSSIQRSKRRSRVEERDDASWPKICRVRLPFTSRCLSYSSISRYMHSIFRDKTTLRPLRPSLISRDAVSFPIRRSTYPRHHSASVNTVRERRERLVGDSASQAYTLSLRDAMLLSYLGTIPQRTFNRVCCRKWGYNVHVVSCSC